MPKTSTPFTRSLLATALGLALAGCAVSPKPFTETDRAVRVKADQAKLAAEQVPVSAPLTLADAVARALKYNMEHRLKMMSSALAANQADLAKYDLLPKLTADAGYNRRDSYPASSSMDVATGGQSLQPSTSQEKTRQTADLALTWNILDFGVSYWQAQQAGDRVLIAEQQRRKTAQTLIQNVRQAYWLAAGAQQLETRVAGLLKEIDVSLADSRKARAERLKPSLEALAYQKSLLDLVRQLEPIRNELAQAKPRLASLMNLAPGTNFTLAVPARLETPALTAKVDALEEQALMNRPELIEADYQERIGVAETKKAMLRMLPGIELSLGTHRDENRFLVDKNWVDGGARVTWNLLGLLSAKQAMNAADQQLEIARAQRLALNMVVLSQVRIAYRDMEGKLREYGMAEEVDEVDSAIHAATRAGAESGADSRMQLIRAEAGSVVSELRKWQAYSNLALAWAQLNSSIGVDAMPEKVASHDLPDLATAFEQTAKANAKLAAAPSAQPWWKPAAWVGRND
jgi:outer membrane protein TolC